MTQNDPDLQELANLDFAYKALRARRNEVIARITARGRHGDQQAMARITGYHRGTVSAIGRRSARTTS